MRKFIFTSCILLSLLVLCSFKSKPITIDLQLKSTAPQIEYAVQKFKELKQEDGFAFTSSNADFTIKATVDSIHLKSEAYKIVAKNKMVEVTGGDATGLMYGLLEIKNQLKSGATSIVSKAESPKLMFRAIKHNLPWSTYRNSEALSLHYETCRDTAYWEAFLDMMVENRFNKLTLWNLHPFSFMVKIKKYPEASSVSDKELAEWQTNVAQTFSHG